MGVGKVHTGAHSSMLGASSGRLGELLIWYKASAGYTLMASPNLALTGHVSQQYPQICCASSRATQCTCCLHSHVWSQHRRTMVHNGCHIAAVWVHHAHHILPYLVHDMLCLAHACRHAQCIPGRCTHSSCTAALIDVGKRTY